MILNGMALGAVAALWYLAGYLPALALATLGVCALQYILSR